MHIFILALGAVPNGTALKLTRVMGTSSINMGEKNQLRIDLDFAVGTTNSVVIEIISSPEATVLAFAKLVNFSVGSNLDQGMAAKLNNTIVQPGIEYVNAMKVRYNTHAIINLGTVFNAGSDTNLAASQISITYEVVMVSNAGLVNGAQYWTGVGMEYNNGQYVWISQISYNLNKTIKSYLVHNLNVLTVVKVAG
ncbi:hypothetical protein CHS0354_035674 [Potamilus streckersoni]|uniref:Uncharacterized protein n=1 Tax=Potamilus streckersoni TaxID=2493646 RepID=A0AAE0RSF2_9BIVA|nr:hypothetical protein CHS0354_035674 [Potamilus streckersoni]